MLSGRVVKFMQNMQGLFKYTDIQVIAFFSIKCVNLWHITRLSPIKPLKVINSQKQSNFFVPLCTSEL